MRLLGYARVSTPEQSCAGQLDALTAQIDTTNATGRLVLHVFAALAKFERSLNHERTIAGLAAARARGRVGGRPRALRGSRRAHACEMAAAGFPGRGDCRHPARRALDGVSRTAPRRDHWNDGR
ncbi:recombinase family protein [Mycolicibacterium septicum DSM 44393]|uniref:Recombinase family protein n=1 Tax=Mycolicibacterium septicum DSM 44393 TaxID=1341646 RepID=A0A7X6MLG1_9MYCO|nr:recombinase family protein [Mycolicibacterium septicum]NKZ10760.1 recombinase family protein [Mycolicibacterium septicum DSM 44393]